MRVGSTRVSQGCTGEWLLSKASEPQSCPLWIKHLQSGPSALGHCSQRQLKAASASARRSGPADCPVRAPAEGGCPRPETWTGPLPRKLVRCPGWQRGTSQSPSGNQARAAPPPPRPRRPSCRPSASPPPAPVQPVLDLGPKAPPAGRASARSHLLRKPAGLHTHQLIPVCPLMRSSVGPRYQRLR